MTVDHHERKTNGNRHSPGQPGDRLARRGRHREPAAAQARRGARPGHRLVAAGHLRRTGRPVRRRPPVLREGARLHPGRVRRAARRPPGDATGTSSTRTSSRGSTSRRAPSRDRTAWPRTSRPRAPPTRRPSPQAGGVDLQILGIGTDGHIGFNEPGSSLASRTRIKTLTRQTRIDNARFFDGDARRGAHALPDPGPGHHHVRPARACSSRPAPARPRRSTTWSRARSARCGRRTILQHHPHVTVLLDDAAARAGCSWPTTTARPTGPSRPGRASDTDGADRRGEPDCRHLRSPLVNGTEQRFQVDDRRAVDRFYRVHLHGVVAQREDPHTVQSQRVGAVRGPRGEHPLFPTIRVVAGACAQHVAPSPVQPGQHQQLLTHLQAVQTRPHLRVEQQMCARSAFVTLTGRVGRIAQRRPHVPDHSQFKALNIVHVVIVLFTCSACRAAPRSPCNVLQTSPGAERGVGCHEEVRLAGRSNSTSLEPGEAASVLAEPR